MIGLRSFFLALMLFSLGCAHSQMTAQTQPEFFKRGPAGRDESLIRSLFGSSNFLQDEYGDTNLISCGDEKFVINHDPNYCKAARAAGQTCTKTAVFKSELLQIDFFRRGSVTFANVRPSDKSQRFELMIPIEDRFMLDLGSTEYGGNRTVVHMTRAATPLSPEELAIHCGQQ